MLFIAFIVGILLQVFVVITPGVNTVFKTYAISWQQWLIAVSLSLLPLIAHEVVVLIRKLKK